MTSAEVRFFILATRALLSDNWHGSSTSDGGNGMATILVVDENPVERRVLRMTLELDDHRLAEAGTSEEAIGIIRKHPVDVVLFSVMPSDPNAYDVIVGSRVGGDRDETRFVAVLSQHDDGAPVEAFMNGAADILIRPFGAPEVRDVIARATSPEQIDLRDRLTSIQFDAYETAIQLQEQAPPSP
jgi:PleD family two-component response regulator